MDGNWTYLHQLLFGYLLLFSTEWSNDVPNRSSLPVCCQQFYGTIASDRVFKFGYLISKREVTKNIKILSI